MKTLFTFFFFLLSTFAKSQSFAPVGSFWNYSYSETFMDCPLVTCEFGQSTIKVLSDTVINNITAKKIIQDDRYSQYPSSTIYYRHMFLGFLFERNDSIFFSSNNTLKDSLYIFGFNMNLHDTLKVFGNSNCIYIGVDSIKNETVNGLNKKAFYVKKFYPCGSMGETSSVHKIIEGIGPVDDYLLWNAGNAEYGITYDFSCFSDGTENYPDNSNCSPLATLNSQSFSFSIYPNPCQSHIKLSAQAISISSVEIYNMNGIKVFYSIPSSPSHSIDLDLNSLPAGIYFLKVSDVNGHYSFKSLSLIN